MALTANVFDLGCYLVTSTNGTRLLVDESALILRSATASSATGLVAADSTGIKSTTTWRIPMPPMSLSGHLWVRLEWEIVASVAGGATGRMNLDLQREGATLPITKANGGARALGAAVATRYEELLEVAILTPIRFVGGQRLDLRFEYEVTVIGGVGTTSNIQINHDAASPGRELIVQRF